MTLLVRNEQAILRENIEYHLSKGVDFIIATDNRSTDSTKEILSYYERLGCLQILEEKSDDYSQSAWVTRMARIAANEFDASWILHADADEFWWPLKHQDLPSYFSDIDSGFDGLQVSRSNFILPKNFDESIPFFAQMSVRERVSKNIFGDPLPGKICHRPNRSIRIEQGNHKFSIPGRSNAIGQAPDLLVYHFPYRGFAQFQKKIQLGGAAYERNSKLPVGVGITWRHMYEMEKKGGLYEFYQAQALSSEQCEKSLDNGELIRDYEFSTYMTSLMPQDESHDV